MADTNDTPTRATGTGAPLHDRPIVVSGFGRSGTTMAMHMLRAGGIPWVPGTHEVSGEQNPPVRFMAGHLSKHVMANPDHVREVTWWGDVVVVWCYRNSREQARSMRKFAKHFRIPWGITDSLLARQIGLFEVDSWRYLRDVGRDVVLLDFDRTIRYPSRAATDLADSLREVAALDASAMAAVVHTRSPRCLPDMAYESGGF